MVVAQVAATAMLSFVTVLLYTTSIIYFGFKAPVNFYDETQNILQRRMRYQSTIQNNLKPEIIVFQSTSDKLVSNEIQEFETTYNNSEKDIRTEVIPDEYLIQDQFGESYFGDEVPEVQVKETEVISSDIPVTETEVISSDIPITETEVISSDIPVTETEVTSSDISITETEVISSDISTTETEVISSDIPVTETEVISSDIPITETEVISSDISTTETEVISSDIPVTETEVISSDIPITETEVISSDISTTETEVISSDISTTETEVISSDIPITETEVISSDISTTETEVISSDIPVTETEVISSDIPTTETEVISSDIPITETEVISSDISVTETEVISSDIPVTETEVISSDIPTTETEVISSDIPITETEVISSDIPVTETEVISSDIPITETEVISSDISASRSEVVLPIIDSNLAVQNEPLMILNSSDATTVMTELQIPLTSSVITSHLVLDIHNDSTISDAPSTEKKGSIIGNLLSLFVTVGSIILLFAVFSSNKSHIILAASPDVIDHGVVPVSTGNSSDLISTSSSSARRNIKKEPESQSLFSPILTRSKRRALSSGKKGTLVVDLSESEESELIMNNNVVSEGDDKLPRFNLTVPTPRSLRQSARKGISSRRTYLYSVKERERESDDAGGDEIWRNDDRLINDSGMDSSFDYRDNHGRNNYNEDYDDSEPSGMIDYPDDEEEDADVAGDDQRSVGSTSSFSFSSVLSTQSLSRITRAVSRSSPFKYMRSKNHALRRPSSEGIYETWILPSPSVFAHHTKAKFDEST